VSKDAKEPKDAKGPALPTTHQLETRTHGRYLVDCPEGAGPFPLLVGFHGYGESAAQMLDPLARIRGQRSWLLASVQGLNRFYNRSANAVVASWMTREDRTLAMSDNLAYVSAVISAVRQDYEANDALILAGFSQGVAMAYRAAVFGGVPVRGLVVLAGDVPPDVVPEARRLPPVLIGRGTADAWYTESKAAADVEVLRAANVAFTTHVFDAGHIWDSTFMARAGSFIDSLLRT
jgi:predicted esterase